jgi:hypothetical protein
VVFLLQASITVGENGSLKLLSKSQEYRFTSEGFVRTTSQQGPCASPDQHCYLVGITSSKHCFQAPLLIPWSDFGRMLAGIRERCTDYQDSGKGGKQCGKVQLKCLKVMLEDCGQHTDLLLGMQVYKAFYAEGNTFVAIKKINCFDKVWFARWSMSTGCLQTPG